MSDERVKRFITLQKLLEAAFDELHAAVLERIADPQQYFSNHHDYPKMSFMSSGFPLFSEHGFYSKTAPKNYVGVCRPLGLTGLMAGAPPEGNFPEIEKLVEFCEHDDIGEKFKVNNAVSSYQINQMVATAVECYLHKYGYGEAENLQRSRVLKPLFIGILRKKLPLTVVVPIALTHFEFDRLRLTENTYVTRIPKGLQLARSRVDRRGSGAVAGVVGAATHAWVSTNWEISGETIEEVREGLNNPSSNVLEEIDSFFASLRAATEARTGYAQVLMVPKRWAFDYFCDLPPAFGATYRRYPNEFDNFGWAYEGQSSIGVEEMGEVRRLYRLILNRPEERVALALKRLNSCVVRDDAADAVLDATIGLEVLLGDDDNQALSYKLRMRAGALANLCGTKKPADVMAGVKSIYKKRSEIVHGFRRKRPERRANEPDDERYEDDRKAAADMLRFVIQILLENPIYLDPQKIDTDLLLGRIPPDPDVPADQPA